MLTNRVRITTDEGSYEGEIIKSKGALLTLRLDDGSEKAFEVDGEIEIWKEAPDEQGD